MGFRIHLQSNLNEVSTSTALRIMTNLTGSILDTPPSPVGSGLYLNFPHLGFYDMWTVNG